MFFVLPLPTFGRDDREPLNSVIDTSDPAYYTTPMANDNGSQRSEFGVRLGGSLSSESETSEDETSRRVHQVHTCDKARSWCWQPI